MPVEWHPHGVGGEAAGGGPEVGVVGAGARGDLGHEVVPSAGLDEAQDGDEHGAGPDEDELQYFVDNGGAQAAQHDVDSDGDGADPHGEVDVPAQDDLHDDGHGVHVDAAHEDGHEGEADAGEAARALAEAKLQIAGDGVRLGDVVEGHHDDAEEEHGGDGADPVPVGGEDSVLVGRAGPAHQFERAEIGGDEAEAGDPGGHLAPGQKELLAGVGRALHIEADEDHHGEVKQQDGDIDRREADQMRGGEQQDGGDRGSRHKDGRHGELFVHSIGGVGVVWPLCSIPGVIRGRRKIYALGRTHVIRGGNRVRVSLPTEYTSGTKVPCSCWLHRRPFDFAQDRL